MNLIQININSSCILFLLLTAEAYSQVDASSGYMGICRDEMTIVCNQKAQELIHQSRIEAAERWSKVSCWRENAEGCFIYAKTLLLQRKGFDAARFYDEACKMGNSQACDGWYYLTFNTKSVSDVLAINPFPEDDFMRSCADGHPRACFRDWQLENLKHGHLARQGLLEKACEGSYAPACAEIATQLHSSDLVKSKDYVVKACNFGHQESCQRAAEMATELGLSKLAKKLHRRICEVFDSSLCSRSLPKNLVAVTKKAPGKEANHCLKVSSEHCQRLADDLRFQGDLEQALLIYRLICSDEHYIGCYSLGLILSKNQQKGEAERAFERGCNRQDARSCMSLSDLYAEQGTKEKAYKFAEMACLQGQPVGCYKTAEFLDRDDKQRLKLLNGACRMGVELACQELMRARFDGGAEAVVVIELDVLQDACQRGSVESCEIILTQRTSEIKDDDLEKLMAKACDLGSDLACAKNAKNLAAKVAKGSKDAYEMILDQCLNGRYGICYTQTNALSQSLSLDQKNQLYEMACQGEIKAACIAGAEGFLLANDLKSAHVLRNTSCTYGDASSCVISAGWYEGQKEVARAQEMYMQACALGNGKGCFRASQFMSEQGRMEQSQELQKKACDHGFGLDCPSRQWAH